MRDWAKESGITLDLEFETGKFINYFNTISGEKAYSRDWFLSWQNWLRRGQEYKNKTEVNRNAGNGNGKLTNAEIYDSYGYYN